ncbi:unnamed protein product [Adineta steineri]|uniref:Uncharacterized protein n=1 Tax=Adineta steineri TaxID=433720 RepID=A0A814JJ93_9BILA|nr:unnamed protein product [Adineta steineri]CAF3922333.1 unnamed protein product [Adineta steineri]
MFIRCLIFVTSLLFVLTNAQNDNKAKQSPINIAVVEHESSNSIAKDTTDQSWQTTTERTLIRVTRLHTKTDQPKINKRERRQVIEAIQTAGFVINVAKAMQNTESGEEILGMAKKVAITVIVIVSLCIVCCLVTTVVICVRCCCGNNNNRKRNQGPTTIQVPQPIYVHTGPSGYQPQYYQQHPPQQWNPANMQISESRPMLPQPSAPPQSDQYYHTEHPPPPYEKLYTGV